MSRPARWPVRSASAISTGPTGRPAEGRQPALRLRPDLGRVPGHPGRGLRAAAGFPGRDPALPGRSGDRDRADPAVFPDQPGADLDRAGGRPDPGGVLPDRPGGQAAAGRGRVLRDLGGVPAGRARAAGRPDPHPVRRGRAYRARRAPGRLVHGLPAGAAVHRDLPGQPGRVRAAAVPLVLGKRGHRVLPPAVVDTDAPPGPAGLRLRVLLLRLHRADHLLRAADPRRHAGLPARAGSAEELRHPAPGHADRVRALPAVAPVPLRAGDLAARHRPRLGARVRDLGRRLWAGR